MSTAAPSPRSARAQPAQQPGAKRQKPEHEQIVTGGPGTSQVAGEPPSVNLWDAVPYIRRTVNKKKWLADRYKQIPAASLDKGASWEDPRMAFAAHVTGLAVNQFEFDAYINALAARYARTAKIQKRRAATKAVLAELEAWPRLSEFSAVQRVVKAVSDSCENWQDGGKEAQPLAARTPTTEQLIQALLAQIDADLANITLQQLKLRAVVTQALKMNKPPGQSGGRV